MKKNTKMVATLITAFALLLTGASSIQAAPVEDTPATYATPCYNGHTLRNSSSSTYVGGGMHDVTINKVFIENGQLITRPVVTTCRIRAYEITSTTKCTKCGTTTGTSSTITEEHEWTH